MNDEFRTGDVIASMMREKYRLKIVENPSNFSWFLVSLIDNNGSFGYIDKDVANRYYVLAEREGEDDDGQ